MTWNSLAGSVKIPDQEEEMGTLPRSEVFFLFCLAIFFCPLPQEKSYVPLCTGVRSGEAPQISISPPILDPARRSGQIVIKVDLKGLWTEQKALGERVFDLVDIPGGSATARVGEPTVPLISVEVEVPESMKPGPLKELATLRKTVENVLLFPVQEPLPIIAVPQKPPFILSQEVYESPNPYPGQFTKIITDGFLGTRHLLILHLFPVQYHPRDRRLKVYSLEVTVPIFK